MDRGNFGKKINIEYSVIYIIIDDLYNYGFISYKLMKFLINIFKKSTIIG